MPARPFPRAFEETTLEELDRLIDINVRGTFVATQAALKHMKSGGRIIMIGSSVGERVMVPGLVPYSATKGAVKMFTQGLSREVGSRGITVNNVQPGPIDTDLNPAAGDWAAPQKADTALDRYGHVEEVAALVAFVAGPEASYITGREPDCGRRHQRLTNARARRLKGATVMDMATLRNKTALVTGASRGIGRATAAGLAGAGAHVLVHHGRSSQEAESLLDSIRAKGGRSEAIRADLATTDGATSLASQGGVPRHESCRRIEE